MSDEPFTNLYFLSSVLVRLLVQFLRSLGFSQSFSRHGGIPKATETYLPLDWPTPVPQDVPERLEDVDWVPVDRVVTPVQRRDGDLNDENEEIKGRVDN